MFTTALIAACLLVKGDSFGPPGAVPVRAETIASGLEVPWSFAFLPGGDVLVSERPGRVRLLRNGKLLEKPVLTVEHGESSEGGLLGIAVNGSELFLYLTAPGPRNELQRWTLAPDHFSARFDKVVLSGIAASRYHDGGRIRFGPDGLLYVGTGDATQRARSQDGQSLNGKLLQIAKDGTARIWASGVRNTEAFDWLDSSTLALADHGPSGEMGRYAHDEVNVVHQGDNLGWPDIYGCETKPGMVTPLLTFDAHSAPPGGLAVYRGSAIPEWKGSILVATLASEHLHRVVISEGSVRLHEVYFLNKFGRLREIAMTPSGELWMTTSNCDGRGECGREKDRILRIVRE